MITAYVDSRTNGFALYDPKIVEDYSRGLQRTDLLRIFTETDEGEEVIRAGILVPVINIPQHRYTIIVKEVRETCDEERGVWKSIGVFPLRVLDEAHLSDLGILIDWSAETASSTSVPNLRSGLYAVTIKLYSTRTSFKGPGEAGYIFDFELHDDLPTPTADLNESFVL